MTLRHNLLTVEDATNEFVDKCAMYRRRNIFIFPSRSVAVLLKNGEVQTFPSLLKATQAIDRNPDDYPY